mgnify:CR=1 FL=1
MPLIPMVSSAFPPHVVANGPSVHRCTWPELVWSAITVGKRELFDVVRHGQYSFFEIVFRAATVFANLKQADTGHIVKSAVYDGQDPSEKAATSYFLGLLVAKLLADAYLDVHWLMHLDVYRHRVTALLTGRSRPDLIGRSAAGHWAVLESKGRTGVYDADAAVTAKAQAGQITTIGGVVPWIRVAVQAHFSAGVLSANWEDPERDESTSAHIDVSDEDLISAYYRPFERMIEESGERREMLRIGQREYDAVRLRDADMTVGLLRNRRPQGQAGPLARRAHPDARTTEGADGVLVRLGPSWDEATMLLEPQQR